MLLKAGMRLRSTADTTEIMVVKAPSDDVELTCGGLPMQPPGEAGSAASGSVPEGSEGTALGKRYADEDVGIELLCTKAGPGDLEVNGQRLFVKGAKPLPSSD